MLGWHELNSYIFKSMEDIPGTLKKGARILWERNAHFAEALTIATQRVLMAFFQTTDFCNASCVMCGAKWMRRERKIMSMAVYQKTIEELAETRGHSVMLSAFAEPLLDPFLVKRIALAAKMRAFYNIGLTTNGSLLTAEMYEKLAEAGLKSMEISIDGFQKEIYEKIRIGLSFERLQKNIFEVLNIHKAMERPISIQISSFTREKKKELNESSLYQRLIESNIIPILKWRVDNWIGLVQHVGGELFLLKMPKHIGPCGLLYDGSLLVLPDGRVTPCHCRDLEGDLYIGSLKNKSLTEIWRGELLEKMRIEQWNNIFKGPCKKCSGYIRIKDLFTRSFVKWVVSYNEREPI